VNPTPLCKARARPQAPTGVGSSDLAGPGPRAHHPLQVRGPGWKEAEGRRAHAQGSFRAKLTNEAQRRANRWSGRFEGFGGAPPSRLLPRRLSHRAAGAATAAPVRPRGLARAMPPRVLPLPSPKTPPPKKTGPGLKSRWRQGGGAAQTPCQSPSPCMPSTAEHVQSGLAPEEQGARRPGGPSVKPAGTCT
jgi:hypothetical protein